MATKRTSKQLVLEMAYHPRTQFLRRMMHSTTMLAPVYLDKCERGYYLGTMILNGSSFHIEAIEARLVPPAGRLHKTGPFAVLAVNDSFQNRISTFVERNEELPCLVEMQDGKSYFIHVEPFSQ